MPSKRVIKYDVRYVEKSDKLCLNVLLAMYTDETGQAFIKFPEGEINLQFIFLKDTFPSSQKEEPYQRIKEEKETIFKVDLFPNEKFYVNYDLCVQNPKALPSLPVIKKTFFVSALSGILAVPPHYTTDEWEIYLRLIDMPKEFKFLTSFDRDNDKREFSLKKSILDFQGAVIVGGQALDFKEMIVQGKPIRVVSENNIDVKLSHLYLGRIIETQRAFWQDDNFPNYLIVSLDVPAQCDSTVPDIAGRHLLNAFLIQTPRCKEKNASHFFWLLSHELFHAWMGGKMGALVKDSKSLGWFMEGFTDYYGLRLAFQSGLIRYSDYINIYNELIRTYYSLPLRDISNVEISMHHDEVLYRWLARLRGHFLAKELAWRLVHDDGNSLDKIVKEIYSRSHKGENALIKQEILDEVFSYSLSKPLQNYMKRKIDEGERFVFSKEALGVFATLANKEVEVPDFGFNLKAFFEDKIIQELKKESAAFKAGLREGQKVLATSVALAHFEKETIIEVEDAGKKKEIRFHHDVVKRIIPQYVLKS